VQHFEALESEVVREEDRVVLEEDASRHLQCGDSLAIAANHIGEDAFGIKRLLLRSLRALTHS
jgi:hypothetical protein